MNFLKNLPGGRAGEANRSDPQSGVSRQIPVNVPVPVPLPGNLDDLKERPTGMKRRSESIGHGHVYGDRR